MKSCRRLPLFEQFIKEQEEAPEAPPATPPEAPEEEAPEEKLNRQLIDLGKKRNELLDQKRESTVEDDLITTATIDIDIQVIDLQMQISRLETDKIKLQKEGV